MASNTLDEYLLGKKLYGDDLDLNAINKWYEDEKEGYADIKIADIKREAVDTEDAATFASSNYGYEQINILLGYRHLHTQSLGKILSIGGSSGGELLPVLEKATAITILEPSQTLRANNLKGVPLTYETPSPSGIMPFPNNSFGLVTCFGTMHHIPNVSTIFSEVHRVLVPGGYFIIREPIVSMGDWRGKRSGLTKNERGIPLNIFRDIISNNRYSIVKESLCGFPGINQLGKFLGVKPYNSKPIVLVDTLISSLFLPNLTYHATGFLRKFRPTAVSYVLKK